METVIKAETVVKPLQLMAVSEVAKLLRISRASIYNHMKAGDFPKAIKVGKHSRWLEAEVTQFITAKAASRGTQS